MCNSCTVSINPQGRTAFIMVDGFLGASATSAANIADRIKLNHHRYVVLNLTKADEIDKDGLKWISELRDKLESANINLKVVTREDSKVRRILKLMQFDKFLSLESSLFKAWRNNKHKHHRQLRHNHSA